MRALLISNSGRPFLAHCRAALTAFLGTARRLAFVTAASLRDEAAYYEVARAALEAGPDSLAVEHLRWDREPQAALDRAEAVFVGGGNTYALLHRLRHGRLVDAIRERVHAGMPYVGSSAGSNVAGPNILTTNDWNVVGSTAFDALGLVRFNVNPHYKETDPAMAPFSETRDERIGEYLLVRDNPVVGIEEGTLVRVQDDGVSTVLGAGRVKLFQRGGEPRWFGAGDRLPV